MAKRVIANFAPRLPGRVNEGSRAFYRKGAVVSARTSMATVLENYTKLIRHLRTVTPDALLNALDPVFQKSQEYVPVKTGSLQSSGVMRVEGEGNNLEGSIVYGNPVAWYAAIVHEYVWLNHEPPTRAKYLQAALEEELDSFMLSLAIDYAAALGG